MSQMFNGTPMRTSEETVIKRMRRPGEGAPNLPAPSLEVTHIAQTYPEAEENEFTAEPFILQRKAEKCPLLFGKPAGR